VESLGTGIGAGAAFFLAVFLIGKGMGKLCENKDIPPAFQGTPAIFIYVALLSLAFTGFSGSSLFV
ncbi:MAG TPA: Rnf-Nqr domain containing protein, partial [Clostridia bacterium]|nr:Rnf-Nqr domain containing protein [Clostridia bacterium]